MHELLYSTTSFKDLYVSLTPSDAFISSLIFSVKILEWNGSNLVRDAYTRRSIDDDDDDDDEKQENGILVSHTGTAAAAAATRLGL